MESELMYNWDDLDVGKFDLEHSQKFFERKHCKHEKLSKDIPDLVLTMEDKENINRLNQNEPPSEHNKNADAAKLGGDAPARKAPPNILHQPLEHRARSRSPTAKANVPSVYKYAEVYEKKKQREIQRRLQEERKNRVFHSRPVPNFNAYHDQIKKTSTEKFEDLRITVAVTPKVLKKSKEMEEKRKQKLEELKKQKAQKFVSRDAHVVHKEPFKPKKVAHVVEPQPFNLLVEKRLEERKQYDEAIKKTFQEKKKQEEEKKRRQEEELVRDLRKLTCFKARKNPFK